MIAIDLGSNTLRVLEYDCALQKQLKVFEKVVKTADGLAQTGAINEAASQRIIVAIKEAQSEIDFSTSVVRAVTTEAMRRASNAKEVLFQIQQATGVAFEVISGDKEAQLTLLAVKHRLFALNYCVERFVVVDIGGGSTELIFHYEDEVITKSFPIGIVTMAQSFKSLEEISQALPLMMAQIADFSFEVMSQKGKVEVFVATAGTPTTVAAMKLGQDYASYDASKINGTVLQADELDVFLNKLLVLSFEQREIAVGVGRSDLIAAGILIYKELFKILKQDTCIVIDDGLREGVALDICQ